MISAGTSEKINVSIFNRQCLIRDTHRLHVVLSYAPANKLTDNAVEIIKAYINSYHPTVLHYRREHAPLRRYLPPELTLMDMYDDFKQKHPGISKRDHYWKTLKSINIGFAKLGEEDCDTFVMHEVYKGTRRQKDSNTCKECLA